MLLQPNCDWTTVTVNEMINFSVGDDRVTFL